MNYIQVEIKHTDAAIREMLVAHLADIGFDSFEDKDDALYAYVEEEAFNKDEVEAIAKQYHCDYIHSVIEQENWNQQWEDSFEPVVVGDFCVIRADFHPSPQNCEHEIIITPKMSFGTGHHATTRLMIQQMKSTNIAEQPVLDFGTGTGVLAILAHQLKASSVLAIDNDEWSYINTLENIERNEAKEIDVRQGSLDVVEEGDFNVILANINRHILLKYMQQMFDKLSSNGCIILSGILLEDRDVIMQSATNCGLVYDSELTEEKWLCMKFVKDS